MKVEVKRNTNLPNERRDDESVSVFPLLFGIVAALVVLMWYFRLRGSDSPIEYESPFRSMVVHDTIYLHDTVYIHDTTQVVRDVFVRHQAAPDTTHYTVAQIYAMYYGANGMKPDRDRAARYARPFAEKGNVDCQMLLGNYYYSTKPMKYGMDGKSQSDYRNAFYWYKRAAQAGNHKAMVFVSEMYRAGIGVEQNTREADRWAARAKEK